MQLPARGRLAEEIGAIEPVRPVDADGTEGRDDAEADTGTAQQTGGVERAAARERRVPATLEVHALEVARAPERAAALRDADRVHRPRGRERQIDPGVAHDRKTDGGADAVVAAQGREARGRPRKRLIVDRVGYEQSRVAVVEQREAELEIAAAAAQLAQVG